MSDHRDDKGRLQAYALQLLNQAEVRLPGISQAQLRAEFFDTMRVWFDETNCWQESIKFLVVPDVVDYPIEPTEGLIIRLIGVSDQNNVWQPFLMPKLGVVTAANPYNQQPGQNGQMFTARVVKTIDKPFENHGIPCFPSWVLRTWGHYLLDGLVGRLMMIPQKGWSNPQLGLLLTGRFRDGMGRARADTAKQNLVGGQPWYFPQTWRTRSQQGGVSVTGSPW